MIRIKVLYSFTVLLIILFALTGCIPGSERLVRLSLQSTHFLNPDMNNQSAPLVINIYELKTAFAFKQASYADLDNNVASLLGQNLIDMQTIEIRPGTSQSFNQYITADTHYLGIVAAYRNIDQANWRKVFKISPHKRSFNLKIKLQSQGLSAKLS